MQLRNLFLLFFLCCLACKNITSFKAGKQEQFDKVKWATMTDGNYPYRDHMLKDFMINYEIHGLRKEEIINLLLQPNRTDSLYLFYTITQERSGFFPLHTKILVIKLKEDSTVTWRKIHE